jgi:hypothetical protein
LKIPPFDRYATVFFDKFHSMTFGERKIFGFLWIRQAVKADTVNLESENGNRRDHYLQDLSGHIYTRTGSFLYAIEYLYSFGYKFAKFLDILPDRV